MDANTEQKLKNQGWVEVEKGLWVDMSDRNDLYGHLLRNAINVKVTG